MKMEMLMRRLTATIIALAGMFPSAGQAQTYDPRYPVCMHVYGGFIGGGEYFDCSFTSIPQCNTSASGRSAMCMINPYFGLGAPPRRSYRHSPPSY